MKILLTLLFVSMLQSCLFSGDTPVDPELDTGAGDVGTVDMTARQDTNSVGDAAAEPDAGADMAAPEDLGDCPPQAANSVVVNVGDDAASDGVCDCTCTLRDGLGHVAPGGTVTFEVMTIELAEGLAIETSDISIDGGAGGVQIDATAVDGTALLLSDEARDIAISRLRIQGAPTGLVIRGDRVHLSQLVVEDGSVGVLVTTSADDVVIETSVFRNMRFHGVFVMGGLGPVQIVESQILGNGGHGLQLRRGDARVEGNVIAGNDLHGIFVDVEVIAPGDTTVIHGNEIGRPDAPNKLGGIEVVRAGVIEIGGANRVTQACGDSCNIIGANRYGVLVQSADEVSIQGNYIGVDEAGDPRPNFAGVIIGLQATDAVDSGDGHVLRDGWVRRRIGGACAHSGDCLRDVDVDGDGQLEQYECVPEQFDVAARSFAYPGGMCTAACDNATNLCAEGICVGNRCFAECSTDDDCRRGYTCSDAACRWAPGSVPSTSEQVWPESRGQTVLGRDRAVAGQLPWTICNGGCNVIAANLGDSVSVVAAPNTSVVGNFIGTGTDPTANLAAGSSPDYHHGISVHPSAANTGRVVVLGNIVGAHAGAGMLLGATAEVDDNWIGYGRDGTTPQPTRGGIVLANGSLDHQIRQNTIGNISLHGILVAQGSSGIIRSNLIGENSGPYQTGIRIYDADSRAEIIDNVIRDPTSVGIAVGTRLSGAPNLLQGIQVRDNTIDGGCDDAGVELFACTDCDIRGNNILSTDGPGLRIGSAGQAVDLSNTSISDNVLEYIGEFNTTSSFVPAVLMLGGSGATISGNQITQPDGAGFVLGAANTDPDFSGTEFLNNTVTCGLASYCQGSGFEVFSGYGAVLRDNTILDTMAFGIDLIDAGSARTSIGFWGNIIEDPFSDSIDFDGVSDPDDGRDDLDNGANTLLNTPSLALASATATGFDLVGEVNFADARIDVYRSDNTTDYPLLSHLGTCYSNISLNPSIAESFNCNVPRFDPNNIEVEHVQATVSGRHYVIYLNPNAAAADVVVSSVHRDDMINIAGNGPAQFAANLAGAIRSNYPELLASPGICGSTLCVHVVGGRSESSFDVSSTSISQTQYRGWVTSKMLETITAVP